MRIGEGSPSSCGLVSFRIGCYWASRISIQVVEEMAVAGLHITFPARLVAVAVTFATRLPSPEPMGAVSVSASQRSRDKHDSAALHFKYVERSFEKSVMFVASILRDRLGRKQ